MKKKVIPLLPSQTPEVSAFQGNLNFKQAKRVCESDKSNPQQKRMNTNSNIDDRQRCSCKKSMCLKLYCHCFAAEFYCDERCSCQECYNRPDYEDTVDETRQQIELRNPLAFSPKTHCLEDGDQLTPFAVHKKGCNCKKSMCQKKYCECYQAKVGCSDGCRCEGCKNVYGKKGEFNMFNKSGSMSAIHEKLPEDSIRLGLSLPEFHDHHNWTPSTPFQHLDHRENASTTHLFDGGYIPPPGSDNCDMILGTGRGNFGMVPLDQQSSPNVEFMNQFPPQDSSRAMNARQPTSVMNLPPMMDWPNLNYPNKKPIYTWDENTQNMPRYSSIHPDTGSSTVSPGDK